MAESIKDSIPKVLKTLWDLENELRGAAQNGVFMRGEEASKHLSEARRHLDEFLGMARSPDESASQSVPPVPAARNAESGASSNNQMKE